MQVVACISCRKQKEIVELEETAPFEFRHSLDLDDLRNSGLRNASVVLYHINAFTPDVMFALSDFKRANPSVPIIVTTDSAHANMVLWALRSRIWDFIIVPEEVDHLRSQLTILATNRPLKDSGERPVLFADTRLDEKMTKLAQKSKTEPAIRFISLHYVKKIMICDLARLCGMSEEHFSRVFKTEQGCTVRDYIKLYRLEAAKQLLQDTSLTVEKIAFDCGYSSLALFNRVFKAYTGNSPSQYRNSR